MTRQAATDTILANHDNPSVAISPRAGETVPAMARRLAAAFLADRTARKRTGSDVISWLRAHRQEIA